MVCRGASERPDARVRDRNVVRRLAPFGRKPTGRLPSPERVVREMSYEHDDGLVAAVGVVLPDFDESLLLVECQ